ncbi:MAG: flippase-like domain-containing protein [Halobacteriaceae archaeon]
MGLRRVVAGFALAAVVLAVFLWSFGLESVLAVLDDADREAYALAPLASLATIALTAGTLAHLYRRVEGAPHGLAFVGGYATGMLLRGLAPWGRSGGSLLTAAAMDRRGTGRFEELLGATVAGEFLGTIGSTGVAVVGVVVLLVAGGGPTVATAGALVAGFLTVLGLLVGVVLAYPDLIVGAVAAVLAVLRGTVGRAWAPADRLLERATVTERTERFLATVGVVARDPGTIGPALALSVLAAATAVVPLWASLRAVGEPVAFPVVMVVVPLTGFAAVVPLPGGTGGVEFALVGLLVATTGVTAAGAAAAVLLYRLATYWLGLAVGTVGTAAFGGRPLRTLPT